ncbi:MAG: RluA family pseudouridine synthase [Pseudomonadota bacterium]
MSDKREQLQAIVSPDQAGTRLDRFLADSLPSLSRSRLKTLIEGGQVRDDKNVIRDAAFKTQSGQRFAIIMPQPHPAVPTGQDIPLDILYEDEDLIVLNKPAGLVVHPAAGNPDGTLVNALIAHCGDSLTGIGGVQRPGIVHRLDKDTSGIMVAAKSDKAHRGLVEQFSARTIERSYTALVWGTPRPRAGTLTGNIGRSPRNRKKMAVLKHGGREAATAYQVERAFADDRVSQVRCHLLTGRTHQIRVHLSHQGHSLLGDPLYGGNQRQKAKSLPGALAPDLAPALAGLHGQALHASTLGFCHPATGKDLRFQTKLPSDIRDLIGVLEKL